MEALGTRRKFPRWPLLAGGIVVAAWVAFAFYLKWSEGGTPPAPAAAPTVANAGRVLLTPRGEAIGVDQRTAMTVLTVPDGTIIRSFDPRAWSEVFNGFALQLSGTSGEYPLRLWFTAANGVQLVADLAGGVRVRHFTGYTGPLVIIATADQYGPGDPRTVHADAGGAVTAELAPLPGSAAINAETGETLDIAQAHRLGMMTSGTGSTRCPVEPRDSPCVAYWSGSEFDAPFAGSVRCGPASSIDIEEPHSGYVLRVETGEASRRGLPCAGVSGAAAARPASVIRGGFLLDGGLYAMRVFDPQGRQVALAITQDGAVYAGAIVPKASCPCRPGD